MLDHFYILKVWGLTQNWKTGKYKCTFIYLLCIFNCHMCYLIQAHSAYCKASQLTVSLMLRQGMLTLFRKPAEKEDSRLMSQNNHLIRVQMTGSFIEQRWGEGEEVN